MKKAWSVVKGFARRFIKVLFSSRQYDYIFIHREAAPLGPPVFEWLLAKVLGKKIIFDFDDAIWIPNVSESNKIARYVKCFWKIKRIVQWSYKVSAGNCFLANWASAYQLRDRVVVNPTCVDMEQKFSYIKEQDTKRLVIGWTGSHSTVKYLDILFPVLLELEKDWNFEFIVICDRKPSFELESLRFVKWKEDTEIEDLLRMNIGVMPLIEDQWSEGKCGFKLIQYLSLGIPAVASPVGVNKTIMEQGVNGFLCSSAEDWKRALEKLMMDKELRSKMGAEGRKKMLSSYSTQSNAVNFISLFS